MQGTLVPHDEIRKSYSRVHHWSNDCPRLIIVEVANACIPQAIYDESRCRHVVDHFISCILRSQSSDDVTTCILSEDILDIHSNVDTWSGIKDIPGTQQSLRIMHKCRQRDEKTESATGKYDGNQ